MGFIAEANKGVKTPSLIPDGRAAWREVFGTGAVSKEDGLPRTTIDNRPGRSSRTVVGTDAAIKRLLQAFRSNAPGGWSDDRWEETRHFVGIAYVAIHRCSEQMAQATFQVFQKDSRHPDGKRPVYEGEPGYELVRLLEKPNEDDSFGDIMYNCFPAGTRIRKGDGSYIPIEDVVNGDQVVTAERNVKNVTRLYSREFKGNIINLRLWGNSHLRLTPNHRVLTKQGYIESKKLTKDDWVAIPKYRAIEKPFIETSPHVLGDIKTTKEFHSDKLYGRVSKTLPCTNRSSWANFNKVPDTINFTFGTGRILGLYLAEGHTEKNGAVIWSFGTHEKETLVKELCGLLRDEWGLSPTIMTRNKNKSVTQVVIYGKLWTRLFRSLCGVGAKNKRLHPDLLSGSSEFLKGVITGWFDGDGHRNTYGRLVGVSVSHDLALAMFDIANYLGWGATIYWDKPNKNHHPVIDGKEIKVNGFWKVEARDKIGLKNNSPKARKSWNCKEDGDYYWRKVRDLAHEPFVGNVYNIEVEGDNSYIAEGIGVHNCNMQLDLTGSSLTWTVPNALGKPFELYPVPTATAVPGPIITEDFPKGYYQIQPLYPYGPFTPYPAPLSAVGARIPSEWMMRIKYPHPFLRYDGYSPLTALRRHLDQIESIDSSRWYSMKRSINPSAVLNMDDMEGSLPLSEPEIERIKAEFEASQMGPENAGQLFVSFPGAKLEPWGSRPADMEYQHGWDQLASFCLGGFGITKQAAGMIEDSSYSTLYATLKQLYWLTLEPKCHRISTQLTRRLAPHFGDNLIVEVQCKRIDDHDVKLAKMSFLMNAKALTKNEARKECEFPLTNEMWGNEIAGQEPLIPVGVDPLTGQPLMMEMAAAGQLPPPDDDGIVEEDEQKERDLAEDMIQEDRDDLLNLVPAGISRNRPTPGYMGRGAMGDRKVKSFHEQLREAVGVNGCLK